jgi:hypothetical protein
MAPATSPPPMREIHAIAGSGYRLRAPRTSRSARARAARAVPHVGQGIPVQLLNVHSQRASPATDAQGEAPTRRRATAPHKSAI